MHWYTGLFYGTTWLAIWTALDALRDIWYDRPISWELNILTAIAATLGWYACYIRIQQ